jgi:hypothetical protein
MLVCCVKEAGDVKSSCIEGKVWVHQRFDLGVTTVSPLMLLASTGLFTIACTSRRGPSLVGCSCLSLMLCLAKKRVGRLLAVLAGIPGGFVQLW